MVKGKRKGHRRAGSNADSIPISVSLTNCTSDLTQEPPQGSFIWLFGAPEIRVSTENSESMQKSSDLSCLAVVSQACAHSSRAAFMARRLDESTVFVIDITKCRHIPVALRIAPNVVWVSRDRRRKSGPYLIQPNGGPSARLCPRSARPAHRVRNEGLRRSGWTISSPAQQVPY